MSENVWYLQYWTLANIVQATLHIVQIVLLYLIWRKL